MKKLNGWVMMLLTMCLMLTSFVVFAQDGGEVPPEVQPILTIIGYVIQFLKVTFPSWGGTIQAILEIIASVATFFTLLTVFVIGALKIPYVIAKWAGAEALAAKIQVWADKIIPILKYFSIFNAPKLK